MSVRSLKPTTVPEAVAAFQSFQRRRGRSEGTVTKYDAILRQFAAWADDSPLSELDAASLEDGFAAQWSRDFQQRNGRLPATDTLRNVYVALGSLFSYLSNMGYLPGANPMHGLETPKPKQKENDYLRPSEDAALLATPMKPAERALVYLLRFSGLRIGEALNLRVEDVDVDSDRPHIRVRASKTDSGIRVVPLVPELVPEVRRWLDHLDSYGLAKPRGWYFCTTRTGRYKDRSTGRVIETAPGSQMKPQQAQKFVKRVGERAGIDGLTPHRLRRTFGSFLLNEGLRLESVSKLLGHASTQVTERAYAELSGETIRAELMSVLGVAN